MATEAQVSGKREALNALGVLRALHRGDSAEAQSIFDHHVIDHTLFWQSLQSFALNFLGIIDTFSRDSEAMLKNGQRLLNATDILDQLYGAMSVDDPENWIEP